MTQSTWTRRMQKMKKQLEHLRLGLLLLVFFILFGLAGTHLMRTTLLSNAHDSNTALACYYVSETESTLTMYRTLLEFGTTSLNVRIERGESVEQMVDWIQLYTARLTDVLDNDSLNVYGVIDGQFVVVSGLGETSVSSGSDSFDAREREWYQDALDADGKVVVSDVYEDVLTGKNVITVAQSCEGSNTVLAFDLYPEDFRFEISPDDLPDGASFFLCDGRGEVLYHETAIKDEDVIDSYVHSIFERMKAGELEGYEAMVLDPDGKERSVDYAEVDNGWYAIITAPRAVILGDLRQVLGIFLGMLGLFVAVLIALTVRDVRRSRAIERTSETVRVLGNSYYAIYLVNYEENTYEMIKGSDYVRARIPEKGPYDNLLRTIAGLIEKDTFDEFEESLSADNIRKLVANRARDFGGDFLRLFGDVYRWVNMRILYDESLAPEEVVLCFREVDQEKQRQLQERQYLSEALEAARASMTSRQAFFNNMSHDMRTPLNAIIGITELARRRVAEPEQTLSYLDRIDQSSKQLLALINDILDISRMEQGSVSISSERMNIVDTLRECALPFQMQAEDQGKRFSMDLTASRPEVMGDPMRFTQVMNNLLSNALKYTDPGDGISLTLEQVDRSGVTSYRITVADTGIGMSEEFLGRLFDLYAREQRFSTVQKTGTGLGMPITKNLVEQMGGTIEVRSKLDEGSTFVVTLPFPVAPNDGDEATQAGEHPHFSATPVIAAPAPADDETAGQLAGKRVLVAEDNPINMEIACEMLSMSGMEVARAWNGREALQVFEASEPGAFDAILMDMQMPELDGCEAARAIRALDRPDAATVPIVAVTANAFAEDVMATTDAGMDAHVSKPIDFAHLCAVLAGLIGSQRGEGGRS